LLHFLDHLAIFLSVLLLLILGIIHIITSLWILFLGSLLDLLGFILVVMFNFLTFHFARAKYTWTGIFGKRAWKWARNTDWVWILVDEPIARAYDDPGDGYDPRMGVRQEKHERRKEGYRKDQKRNISKKRKRRGDRELEFLRTRGRPLGERKEEIRVINQIRKKRKRRSKKDEISSLRRDGIRTSLEPDRRDKRPEATRETRAVQGIRPWVWRWRWKRRGSKQNG